MSLRKIFQNYQKCLCPIHPLFYCLETIIRCHVASQTSTNIVETVQYNDSYNGQLCVVCELSNAIIDDNE